MIQPVEILIAEDEQADIDLIIHSISSSKYKKNINVVNNGAELLKFLRKEGVYSSAPSPDLILMDLNMPVMCGREALEKIRADIHLTHLPVVVLTTSTKEEDVLKSYKLHANCYVQKPLRMAEFQKFVNAIEDFWFSVAKMPSKKSIIKNN